MSEFEADHLKPDWGVFWMGANGCEFIAYKNSTHISVNPTWEHPQPPSQIIFYGKPIETERDFQDALENGRLMDVQYVNIIKKEA